MVCLLLLHEPTDEQHAFLLQHANHSLISCGPIVCKTNPLPQRTEELINSELYEAFHQMNHHQILNGSLASQMIICLLNRFPSQSFLPQVHWGDDSRPRSPETCHLSRDFLSRHFGEKMVGRPVAATPRTSHDDHCDNVTVFAFFFCDDSETSARRSDM